MSGYRKVHADEGLGGVSGTVASLPVGYTLGEERSTGGKLYRLIHNAGNSQVSPGYFMVNGGAGAGPYSLTISSTSNSRQHIGAALVEHATLATGYYGWGFVRGYTTKGLVPEDTIATGAAFQLSNNGKARLAPQSLVTGNALLGYNVGAVGTMITDTLSGDAYINLM